MKNRIMYIETKEDGVSGSARIGRVTFSKTGRSVYYRGRRFEALKNGGFKSNYFDCETGEEYWVSGCKKKGGDRLYPGTVEIDVDVREEYWTEIREMPEKRRTATIRCPGKYGGRGPN
ncbi:MAG: 1-deoxy-D-xylulose-5-phosphate synthase [Acidobacteriia bacterium]|nr:1-deoxy-D-xylulose-5-phosphate synthase [Terriglobia bacterium]